MTIHSFVYCVVNRAQTTAAEPISFCGKNPENVKHLLNDKHGLLFHRPTKSGSLDQFTLSDADKRLKYLSIYSPLHYSEIVHLFHFQFMLFGARPALLYFDC